MPPLIKRSERSVVSLVLNPLAGAGALSAGTGMSLGHADAVLGPLGTVISDVTLAAVASYFVMVAAISLSVIGRRARWRLWGAGPYELCSGTTQEGRS